MTNLMKFKTENQIYSDFISLVKAALTTFDLKGWEVRQLNQVFKVNVLKNTVFISINNNADRGRQYNRNFINGNTALKEYSVKHEINIRFSATHRDKASDTVKSINATDVLKLIKNYLQSDDGIVFISKMGYAQYRAGEVSEQSFLNDEDNFQFMPYFDCTILYTDSWQSELNKISKITEKGIYKI